MGGNNRKFLEKSSSMKHEVSTLQSITLDFAVLKGNKPNIIDISFSNIIDETLDLIIAEPKSSSSTFKKNNTNNNKMVNVYEAKSSCNYEHNWSGHPKSYVI